MGLAEPLNTEQAIVPSLRHNDLIELHLKTARTKKKQFLLKAVLFSLLIH